MLFKGYFVNIPPLLNDVLADIGNRDKDDDFEDIVNSAVQSFFSFYTPRYISANLAVELEKYVLHYYIMRRIGSGNVKKFRQIFRNKWNTIMPYYERILETIENENSYFTNPILTADIHRDEYEVGTNDEVVDTIHNADTVFDTTRDEDYEGAGTHTTDDDIDRSMEQNDRLTHDEDTSKSHTGSDTKSHEEDTTKSHTGTDTKTIDEETGKVHEGSDTKSHDETTSKSHTGNFSETGNSVEVNRYLDTPQSVADRVWETDGQGHLKLSDYYLTDIRGITNEYSKSGNDAYNESGTDNYSESGTNEYSDTINVDHSETGTNTYSETGSDDYNESGTNTFSETGTDDYTDVKTISKTEGETLDRDEATTSTYDKSITGRDITDFDELSKKTTDQDTTRDNDTDRLGYDGYSPADLLMRYRDTFTRTFEEIATELQECFYNLVEVDDLIDFV